MGKVEEGKWKVEEGKLNGIGIAENTVPGQPSPWAARIIRANNSLFCRLGRQFRRISRSGPLKWDVSVEIRPPVRR
ncbi:MAG: hypothetical protein A2201_02725 [Alicyclobacillus sp. RIFOXYA1_FULL_53_8]|nr:MAG: hypothetical protein A2201_02725 [Alicyclobacillus sp. RIFOXYA1_FULL_53_8]